MSRPPIFRLLSRMSRFHVDSFESKSPKLLLDKGTEDLGGRKEPNNGKGIRSLVPPIVGG